MRKRMWEGLRRSAPSSHRSEPTSKLLTRRSRVFAAGVLPLAMVGLTFTGVSAFGAQSPQPANLAYSRSAAPQAGSLTTEHVTDPLGIDNSHPLLSWVVTSAARGVVQSKYEIRVAKNENNLVSGHDLVWDSHIVASSKSFDVAYGGPALESQTRYYWQVRVWTNHGHVSPWSQPAWFETAFLNPSQFQGNWIGQYPDAQLQKVTKGELLFRKQFNLAADSIKRARLYVSGLSYPYTDINGHRVSDTYLNTPFTSYNKTVDYSTYNVTRLVRSGANALTVSLGHGFYSSGADDYARAEPWQPAQPKLKLELKVWYANGTSAQILSNGTWKVSTGPVTADTPAAQTTDARLEKPGWRTIGYNDSTWSNASVVSAPAGTLRANLIPPVQVTGTIKPVKVTEPKADTKVYKFPITTSGWSRIKMQGKAGTKVYIEYSEKLNSNGTVQIEGNHGAGQTDVYILKGGGPETYDPVFGWKGYEYVEVSTANPTISSSSPASPLPQLLSVTGVIAHTNLPTSGNFTSSSKLLNTMHNAMKNTILNNQYSYGSDTPVYEKGGWTNDNGDYSVSEMANFNAEAYYQHMMRNFDNAQAASGNIGVMVPTPGGPSNHVDPLWGGSYLIIEYNMYKNYDDLAVIRRDYSYMAAYINYMASLIKPDGYIYQGTTFGDWSVPTNANPPSSEMLGSMFLYREAKDLAIMAAAIGNTAGASKYNSLAATIRTAVNKEFYDAAGHMYRDPLGLVSHAIGGPEGTITTTAYDQTANAIGLAFGLAPARDRQTIANGLAANVVAKGNHLATGANGTKFILPMLTQAGYANLAYKVATNPTYPGWGHWFLQCGATTMWEAWSCTTARSHDHAFMGTVDDWLYSGVAGIQATSAGFRTVSIKPSPVGNLTHASAYETTPLGRVSSSWTRHGTSFALTAQVPVGSQATVCVPAASARSVTESGNPIGRASGVTVIGMQGSCLQLRVGSGTYKFHSTMS